MDQTDAPATPVQEAAHAASNLTLGIAAGVGAALAGAAIWAVVTVVTEMELGLMAIAVGFIVGWAVREVGKGTTSTFGIVGAACALLGCVLGNLLSAMAFYGKARGVPFFDVLTGSDPAFMMKLLSVFFDPMDLIFYGIALYEGYRFSIVTPAVPAAAAS